MLKVWEAWPLVPLATAIFATFPGVLHYALNCYGKNDIVDGTWSFPEHPHRSFNLVRLHAKAKIRHIMAGLRSRSWAFCLKPELSSKFRTKAGTMAI